MTDTVDKGAVDQHIGNNRILVSRSMYQHCATACRFDSMLPTRSSDFFYRQHRPGADIGALIEEPREAAFDAVVRELFGILGGERNAR